jgi:hypothetical protein
MKNKLITLLCFITLILLAGCVGQNNSAPTPVNTLKTPPSLTISVGEEVVTPVMGTYSWSYSNNDGTETGVEADSDAPPGLIKNQKVLDVTPSTDIDLNFGIEPIDYEVNIWDSNYNVIGTYDEVVLNEYSGLVIYEVFATWPQGSASYAFTLNIKE